MTDFQYDLEDRLIDFAVAILDLVEELPGNKAANHICGQLIRCGTAPAPNYGEAQGAESRKDFIHKMRIVLKELKETRVWLKIINKKKYISEDILQPVLTENEELIRIIAKSIITASSS